jgi:hypothetical protein
MMRLLAYVFWSSQASGVSPTAPGAVENLLKQGSQLDAVQASMDAAFAAGEKMRLKGLASECGIVMTALDGIDCGPRGSPARELRREILRRAEDMAKAAERDADTL